MQVGVVTLFPEMFSALTGSGVSARAVSSGLLSLSLFNPRDYTEDKHRTVDDRPYGGGPGMVMAVSPLLKSINAAKAALQGNERAKVVYLSPQGKRLDQAKILALAKSESLILLCGRYEGVDERLLESEVDEEISIGDYVISGGELAAMVLLDGIIRQLPGALGHEDSAQQDSFSDREILDWPHYTRPERVLGREVPSVLLGGNHKAIARWRLKQSLLRTRERRPDLFAALALSAEEKALLDEDS